MKASARQLSETLSPTPPSLSNQHTLKLPTNPVLDAPPVGSLGLETPSQAPRATCHPSAGSSTGKPPARAVRLFASEAAEANPVVDSRQEYLDFCEQSRRSRPRSPHFLPIPPAPGLLLLALKGTPAALACSAVLFRHSRSKKASRP